MSADTPTLAAAARRETTTDTELAAIGRFLDRITYQGEAPLNGYGYHGVTREQYWESYPSWSRGGRGWLKLHQGGTGIMAAICWYQHIHRPGSREWRPSVIIAALREAALTEASHAR